MYYFTKLNLNVKNSSKVPEESFHHGFTKVFVTQIVSQECCVLYCVHVSSGIQKAAE